MNTRTINLANDNHNDENNAMNSSALRVCGPGRNELGGSLSDTPPAVRASVHVAGPGPCSDEIKIVVRDKEAGKFNTQRSATSPTDIFPGSLILRSWSWGQWSGVC